MKIFNIYEAVGEKKKTKTSGAQNLFTLFIHSHTVSYIQSTICTKE